jgi:hypothetical protein
MINALNPFCGSQDSLEIIDTGADESERIQSVLRAQALKVRCAACSRQVVENNDFVFLLDQPGGQIRAYEANATCDENATQMILDVLTQPGAERGSGRPDFQAFRPSLSARA